MATSKGIEAYWHAFIREVGRCRRGGHRARESGQRMTKSNQPDALRPRQVIMFILFWLACATESAGTTFAFFQGYFSSIAVESYTTDMGFAWLWSFMFGPIASVLSAFLS